MLKKHHAYHPLVRFFSLMGLSEGWGLVNIQNNYKLFYVKEGIMSWVFTGWNHFSNFAQKETVYV